MVSPGGNVLWTCDPEAVLQFSKRQEFVKPVEMMRMLNMYGPTITGTDGEESRLYRKIAGPSFNGRTHRSVWNESIIQTRSVLDLWTSSGNPIGNLNKDLARLTLHLISYVCFDHKTKGGEAGEDPSIPDKGHHFTYEEAIGSMLDNIPILFTVPPPFLRTFPIPALRRAKASYEEWEEYMNEMRDGAAQKLVANGPRKEMSILESFVRAGQGLDSTPPISPEAVLGNIFIFIIAGYETSANTLNYAILLLACHPELQEAMQVDLNRILDNRPSSDWSFESDFPKLLDGFVGAVMNEILRLYTVLPFLPECTREMPVPMQLGGREYIVPADTSILMNTSATHRNPKYWPAAELRGGDGPPYPVSSFNPRQWLQHKGGEEEHTSAVHSKPGSWIPFSGGHRACLGKRFAQAEFCAVMAAIFKDYSVEVVIEGEDVGEREVERSAWEKAKESAEKDGVDFLMSLKMSGTVPVLLVKRGQERKMV